MKEKRRGDENPYLELSRNNDDNDDGIQPQDLLDQANAALESDQNRVKEGELMRQSAQNLPSVCSIR